MAKLRNSSITSILCLLLICDDSGTSIPPTPPVTETFSATGNTSVDDSIYITMEQDTKWPYDGSNGGEDARAFQVTFPSNVPMKITGLTPSNVVVEVLKNDKTPHSMMFTGSLESYDNAHPSNCCNDQYISWESPASPLNSMWIHSQNPARIVVKIRTAMVWEHWNTGECGQNNPPTICPLPNPPVPTIARDNLPGYLNPKVTPEWVASNGRTWTGEWSEEFYYIYPDGVHTRYAIAYTQNAHKTLAFGKVDADRDWLNSKNTVHDFGDVQIWYPTSQGLSGTLKNQAGMTLMKMDGSPNDYSLYQPFVENNNGPGADNLMTLDNGDFQKSNIVILNLVGTTHKPFVVGEAPDSQDFRYTFNEDADYLGEGNGETDSAEPNYFGYAYPEDAGSKTLNVGFLVNQYPHERVAYDSSDPGEAYVSQVYLRGVVVNNTAGNQQVLDLARSWERAPAITNLSGASNGRYEQKERAYKMSYTSGNQVAFTIQATVTRPFVRGGVVIENWGANKAVSNVTINGLAAEYIVGYEGDMLVLWLNENFDSSSTILISG